MKKVGIDIGVSHVGIGVFSSNMELEKEEVFLTKEIYQDVGADYTLVFSHWLLQKLDSMVVREDIFSIGIGCPGGVDRKKGIFLGSSKMKLGEICFRDLFSFCSLVFVENDCNCAALAEIPYMDTSFLFLTIGSGVGFSYVDLDSSCFAEDSFIWKILELNKKDPSLVKSPKYISSFLVLSRRYNTLVQKQCLRNEIMLHLDEKEVFSLFYDYLVDMAKGFSLIYEKYGISTFVLGGGFSEYFDLYSDELQKLCPDFVITCAHYFNFSGVFGAALLAEFFEKTFS